MPRRPMWMSGKKTFWGWLGLDILASGQSAEIPIGDGRSQCLYDLRLVWDDGDVTDEVGADLCETGGFTLE